MHTITIVAAFVLLIPTFCLASDGKVFNLNFIHFNWLIQQWWQTLYFADGLFQLYNKATEFCVLHTYYCPLDALRWTSGDRLLVPSRNKCLGAEGTSVGSGISQYECDEKSDLQKWECKNETLLALKGHELYVELINDGEAVLTKTIGPKTHLTVDRTPRGPCTKKARGTESFIHIDISSTRSGHSGKKMNKWIYCIDSVHVFSFTLSLFYE